MKTKEKDYIFRSLIPIVETIAETFGNSCEVLLHDFSDPNHSIIKIENGHITGRKVGDPMTNLALTVLHNNGFGKVKKDKMINYMSKTKDGKILKSSSVNIRDSHNEIIGSLCINFNLTEQLFFKKFINEFCETQELDKEESGKESDEKFLDNVYEVLVNIIQEAKNEIGKPISIMQKEDKLKVVKIIDGKGAFLIKGSIDKIAEELNVSRYTVYNYLEELKAKERMQ
ncbi:MAG: helix-turn-helix transcriptional regulator [Atribacterota bacterium]|nr:helix-turn-helix transcriptional regulator [Atribacterota bacterium]